MSRRGSWGIKSEVFCDDPCTSCRPLHPWEEKTHNAHHSWKSDAQQPRKQWPLYTNQLWNSPLVRDSFTGDYFQLLYDLSLSRTDKQKLYGKPFGLLFILTIWIIDFNSWYQDFYELQCHHRLPFKGNCWYQEWIKVRTACYRTEDKNRCMRKQQITTDNEWNISN